MVTLGLASISPFPNIFPRKPKPLRDMVGRETPTGEVTSSLRHIPLPQFEVDNMDKRLSPELSQLCGTIPYGQQSPIRGHLWFCPQPYKLAFYEGLLPVLICAGAGSSGPVFCDRMVPPLCVSITALTPRRDTSIAAHQGWGETAADSPVRACLMF